MTPLLGHYSTGLDLAAASPDPVLCCLLCLYIIGFLNFYINSVISLKAPTQVLSHFLKAVGFMIKI